MSAFSLLNTPRSVSLPLQRIENALLPRPAYSKLCFHRRGTEDTRGRNLVILLLCVLCVSVVNDKDQNRLGIQSFGIQFDRQSFSARHRSMSQLLRTV